MDIFDFLIYIVRKFRIVPKTDLEDIEKDMSVWRRDNMLNEEKQTVLAKLYRAHGRQWYVRLGLALLTIPAIKYISKYMAGDDEWQEEEEFEEEPLTRKRK